MQGADGAREDAPDAPGEGDRRRRADRPQGRLRREGGPRPRHRDPGEGRPWRDAAPRRERRLEDDADPAGPRGVQGPHRAPRARLGHDQHRHAPRAAPASTSFRTARPPRSTSGSRRRTPPTSSTARSRSTFAGSRPRSPCDASSRCPRCRSTRTPSTSGSSKEVAGTESAVLVHASEAVSYSQVNPRVVIFGAGEEELSHQANEYVKIEAVARAPRRCTRSTLCGSARPRAG